MNQPGVLMVTGAYWPELSGGGLQCQTVIRALGNRIRFRIWTTSTDPALSPVSTIDGVPVTRAFVDMRRPITKIAAAFGAIRYFLAHQSSFDVVHLHGFSQKSVLIALLSGIFGKKLVITIHTAGQDEPAAIRKLGALAYWCYSRADRFIAISERMAANYRESGLPLARLRLVPNTIDSERFRPPSASERREARSRFGELPVALPWVLFVGFFSKDKSPDVLFEGWLRLLQRRPRCCALLFVGATASRYHEVDPEIAARIKREAAAKGVADLVHFAGELAAVEDAYRASDIFVMPSVREAFGMALLEGMATGLPVVATRIAGVTDTIIDAERTGILVEPRDPDAIAAAIARLLDDRPGALAMGARARQDSAERYGFDASAARWLAVYSELLS